jgi:lipopolysaccharide export system protein LptC
MATSLVVMAQDPIEDLRVPMEYYADGTLKSELLAARAEVLADETIAASGLVFRVFTTNALVDITIKATDALCSRQQQTATSEKAVEMQRGELRMTGEGFEWNGTNGTLRIRRQARITFPSEMIKAEGVLDHVR